jgi:CxxC motif-containing protein (DUF1111 family)
MLCHSKISEITPNLTIKMFTNLSTRQLNYLVCTSLFLFSLNTNSEASLPESLSIEVKDVIEWDTTSGQTYQLQKSTTSGVWNDEGSLGQGDGHSVQHELHTLEPGAEYRLVKTMNVPVNHATNWDDFASSEIPGAEVSGENNDIFNLPNGSVEWDGFYNTLTSIYPLKFTNGGSITFTAYVQGGGDAHIFFRFEKDPYPEIEPYFNIGDSEVTWQDQAGSTATKSMPSWPSSNSAIKISGGTPTNYTINIPSQGSNTFSSLVLYIVENETPIVLQDILVTDDQTVAGGQEIESLSTEMITEVSWPSLNGVEYDVMESSNLVDWSDAGTDVLGDGSTKTVTMTMDQASRFIRVIRPDYELFAPSDPSTQPSLIENALNLAWNPSTTPTVVGYRVYYGTEQNNLNQTIDVPDGNSVTIENLIPETTYFFAVVSIDINDEQSDLTAAQVSGEASTITLVPLYNEETDLEAPSVTTEHALVTIGSDRGRLRHAREGQFQLYDQYASAYWDGRAYYYEIIDRVGYDSNQGGNWSSEWDDTITINMITQYPLNSDYHTGAAEMRTFHLSMAVYRWNFDAIDENSYGRRKIDGTLEFHNPTYDSEGNMTTNYLPANAPLHYYTHTLKPSDALTGPMGIGDTFEIELSQFGLPTNIGGQANYYATAFLYKVGTGLLPWYGEGNSLTATPLPTSAKLGGGITQHTPYSNEPYHAFKQMAYNLSYNNGQKFMDGRRLHHTDFSDGSHSELGNIIFAEHTNELGPKFVNASCVECHTNNGRAIPNKPGDLMNKSIVRVGLDSSGTHHDTFGSVLQVAGSDKEMLAYRDNYEIIEGEYGDGTSYTLRKPKYSFSGNTPDFYSVRSAPQLVGLGLLEAIDENRIISLSNSQNQDNDKIKGKYNIIEDPFGEYRIGRFGYKASKASVTHHIASALNTDMGVTTNIYPTIDFEELQPGVTPTIEVSDEELDLMYRYVALLAVMPQREFNDTAVIQGKELFNQANCVVCHVETHVTSQYHPLTELRNQTIHPYTDLLLHDMGPGLADNMGEGLASGSEWRTAPLWNIGYTEGVSGYPGTKDHYNQIGAYVGVPSEGEAYLHDGRARTLEEAILWHGGEAEASKEAFKTMSASDRSKLITFLKSL